jgi:outer membrane protein assembly factor BamB
LKTAFISPSEKPPMRAGRRALTASPTKEHTMISPYWIDARNAELRIVGQHEVTESRVEWTDRDSSYAPTPLSDEGVLYRIDDRGTFHECSGKDGELLPRDRVTEVRSPNSPLDASPIANYQTPSFQTRYDEGIVAVAPSKIQQPKLQVVSPNRFESDTSMFNATPAVGNGELLSRSNTTLVCIAKTIT